jgi:predicted secreted protein
MCLYHGVLLFLTFFACVTNTAAHEEKTLFNQVHVQAQAQAQVERDIPNDQMQSLLASEHQGKNASELSARVNPEVKISENLD